MKTARSLKAAEMHAKAIEKNETSENNNAENNSAFEELSATDELNTDAELARVSVLIQRRCEDYTGMQRGLERFITYY